MASWADAAVAGRAGQAGGTRGVGKVGRDGQLGSFWVGVCSGRNGRWGVGLGWFQVFRFFGLAGFGLDRIGLRVQAEPD